MTQSKIIFKVVEILNRIMGIVSGVAVICLSFVIFFEMIARKVFNMPTLWSHDISIYLFLFITFLALSFTMQENGHIGFNILINHFKKSSKILKISNIISGIFGTLFCLILILTSLKLLVISAKFNWLTHGQTQIPVCYLYSIMFFGSFVLLITFLLKIMLKLFNKE